MDGQSQEGVNDLDHILCKAVGVLDEFLVQGW